MFVYVCVPGDLVMCGDIRQTDGRQMGDGA